MKVVPRNQFTHSHIVADDGTVTFQCSSDIDIWPWLALQPFDPIVVQTINYWASVETGAARGTLDPTKWSALTQTEWTCGQPGTGHAVRGVADGIGSEDKERYRLRFFDAQDALVYSMSGRGVVFKTRDFESWRQKAKEKEAVPDTEFDFQYANASAVGVATQRESFLSPLAGGNISAAQALITKKNGFTPSHPYHSGSGDHVNANHLADVGRQFCQLLLRRGAFAVTGGEMEFQRYVELGRPFQIALEREFDSREPIVMAVHQGDRLCAKLKFCCG